MRSAEPARDAAGAWDIACPSRPHGLPGVRMAGFRQRAAPVDLRVIPFPAVTIAIDFGESPVVVGDSGHERHGSVVVGLAPTELRVRGRDVACVPIRLSPIAAHTMLGGSAPESGGAIVGLDDLLGRDAARAEEQLHTARSWEERFAIAEAALARRQEQRGHAVDAEVAFAWSELEASGGQVRVEELAGVVGWSRKRLWSRFRSQVGLTPKRAAQLVRFDHAAHRLAAGERAAQVAAEGGFSDQSHLHRDVAAFTGGTPADVAAAPWLAVDDVAWAIPRHAPPPLQHGPR